MSSSIATLAVYSRSSGKHGESFKRQDDAERSRALQWGDEYASRVDRRLRMTGSSNWYIWRFNDVVAWLDLRVLHGQFYIDEYRRIGRVTHLSKHRNFFELREERIAVFNAGPSATSDEIGAGVVGLVEECRQSRKWPRAWVVDAEDFSRFASYVCWRRLVDAR